MSESVATSIYHYGHTSFGVTRGETRILIDPITVRLDLDFGLPCSPQWLIENPEGVHAIFISHAHDDHLHPPSMLLFPPEVAVYFLGTCRRTRSLLTDLGFTNTHPVLPGDRIELPGDLSVHIIPAEDSSEGLQQCCILVNTPDVCFLDAVDIKDSAVTREALEPYRGKVDIAFVPAGTSIQWQGSWNQMDTVDAVSFCQWLRPKKVAPCGGALSMSEKPRLGALTRYPSDFGDWQATAIRQLSAEQLLRERPPFRASYASRRLSRCVPLRPASTFRAADGAPPARAVISTLFTGYDPRQPSKRLGRLEADVLKWAGAWAGAERLLQNSEHELQRLIGRCNPPINQTPAAVLAPCTLKHLSGKGEFGLAARLSALTPPPVSGVADLELYFFSMLEAVVENSDGLSPGAARTLRACLWLDRRLFQLKVAHLEMKRLATLADERAGRLADRHLEDLQRTFGQRRPVLGHNQFRVDQDMARLLDGVIAWNSFEGAEISQGICYASPAGVQGIALSRVELLMLDLCDGRPTPEIVAELAGIAGLPRGEVEDALFRFLAHLTRESILLVDWSL